ncbi:MAG: FecR family protein [bacterium]|jgi:transmembrane sensor
MAVEIEIHDLIVRSLKGSLTPTEQEELDRWLAQSAENRIVFDRICDTAHFSTVLKSLDTYDQAAGWLKVKNRVTFKNYKVSMQFQFLKMTAVLISLLMVSGTSFFIYQRLKGPSEVKLQPNSSEIYAPQSSKATLRLENGREIPLESIEQQGQILADAVKLVRKPDGAISYELLKNGSITRVSYNTISNPKGSKVVDLFLSDGTHVWLNAGSSITYPIVFVGNKRSVNIVGEAYFEVAKNPQMPFWVQKEDFTLKVLGTAFNVNAYDNESQVMVTLLHGKVTVSLAGVLPEIMLKPAQQASIGSNISVFDNVDTESVIAWKNGYFSFNKADIKTVMRQIERWYDVEVELGSKYLDRRFTGEISRMSSVSKVLEVLKESNIHCYVEGKKVIIK